MPRFILEDIYSQHAAVTQVGNALFADKVVYCHSQIFVRSNNKGDKIHSHYNLPSLLLIEFDVLVKSTVVLSMWKPIWTVIYCYATSAALVSYDIDTSCKRNNSWRQKLVHHYRFSFEHSIFPVEIRMQMKLNNYAGMKMESLSQTIIRTVMDFAFSFPASKLRWSPSRLFSSHAQWA